MAGSRSEKSRDIGIDLTRIAAFLSVVSVHFFLNSGFYDTPVLGKSMYLMSAARTFFMICVPLFLLLTGYLMVGRRTEPDRRGYGRHCLKLLPVLASYVLCTCVILLFRSFCLRQDLSLKFYIQDILGFWQYSWYVNMYIGLYLLIPFLNLLWESVGGRSGQRVLTAVMIALTAAPGLFNSWDFTTAGALARPWISDSYSRLVPDWWCSVYPVTYYFIGAYLRSNVEIKKLKTWKLLLLLAASALCFGLFNVWRSYSVKFVTGPWCAWGGFQNVINATLVFLLINSIQYPKPCQAVSKTVGLLAELTFDAYLLSWIPDTVNYQKLDEAVSDMPARFAYFPVMTGVSAGISLVIALPVHAAVSGMKRCLDRMAKREGRPGGIENVPAGEHAGERELR